MIMDADAFIDFLKSEPSVLRLVAQHLGPVCVLEAILEEVEQAENEANLIELGLTIVETEVEDAYAAVSMGNGPTSFHDRLCMLTAKRHSYACITNDKKLRALCKTEGIETIWGLQLLLHLHAIRGISTAKAIRIAQKIHRQNPRHIHEDILNSFINKLRP